MAKLDLRTGFENFSVPVYGWFVIESEGNEKLDKFQVSSDCSLSG